MSNRLSMLMAIFVKEKKKGKNAYRKERNGQMPLQMKW